MDFLTFSMDKDLPLYQQLYEYIKDEIKAGRISCNEKLPSKRKLSSYLKISQNTIQAAYDQLIEEGYVIPSARRGFYVSELDNIHCLNTLMVQDKIREITGLDEIEYDFSVDGVDKENFPFAIWRKLMKETVSEYDDDILELGDSQGYMNLRTSIARYLRQSRGVVCTQEQIIISSGTEFLLQLLVQLLEKNSVYGLEDPGYERLSMLFKNNAIDFRPISIDNKGMIPEEIIKSGVNVIYIAPAHQFPSGSIMPINRRLKLLNWANTSQERYIIEDDYDSEFKYSGKPIPALKGMDTNDKVIYMGSFSKSISPATRVSYMVLPEALLISYKERLSYFMCPVPMIDQKVLYRFIGEGYFEKHLNKMRTVYKRKRELLIKEIERLDIKKSIEIHGSDAGLHLLLQVDNGMSEELLVYSALMAGVKVYALSRYIIKSQIVFKKPTMVLGFAALTENEIKKAVIRLLSAWKILKNNP